jgi:hypothetical protein
LSSTIDGQKPCGFALTLAFLITVIFAILASPKPSWLPYAPAR